MGLAELDHPPVNVHQHHFLDRFVLQGFVGDGEIAAAHDQHPLHPAMLEHGQMGEHVGIGALVPAGDLDDVVQGHHPAIGHRVEDFYVLVAALFVGQNRRHLHRLGIALVEFLFNARKPGHNHSLNLVAAFAPYRARSRACLSPRARRSRRRARVTPG